MRLINTSTLQLKEFFGKSPPYAILSHTWEDDEVSFQDMERGAASHRKGYAKIEWTCRLAEQRGLQWAWVDTCCIDKPSSSELSEAINSMFQWYKDAVVCYAFLGDLDSRLEWPQCKWFKRGWTLQELIAPRNVEFYDRDWTLRGTKRQLEDRIHEITRIDKAVLLNQDALGTVPVARRMSWAARRETTRVEDGAYCLLGIFEVNMPMLYGEGPNAFFRLQEEIMKASNDMSLFAWSRVAPSGRYRGILAHSPAEFRDCGAIDLADEDMYGAEFRMTNKGLHITTRLVDVPYQDEGYSRAVLPLHCTHSGVVGHGVVCGIYLRKKGPDIYIRDAAQPLARVSRRQRRSRVKSVYIERNSSTDSVDNCFKDAIYFPLHQNFPRVIGCTPEGRWDTQTRTFLTQGTSRFWCALSLRGELDHTMVHLVVVCILDRFSRDCQSCFIFDPVEYDRQATYILQNIYHLDTNDVLETLPDASRLGTVMFRGRSEGFVVRASIKRGKVPGIDDSEVFSVDIKVQAPSAAIALDLKKPTPSIDIGPQPQKATPATPSKMPSITCSRCSRVGIERELHYSCDICNGGKWSLCLKCYRAGNGCLHWFGFGQRAWVKWEQARENDPTLSRPHILSPSRFVPLEEPISGGQSTYDRDFRREQGAFCARCFASANECYWQCNMCNDGAWGYCNNCVNQGYICTHALLPLKAKASQLTMAEPSTLLHPWEPTTECERCLGPIPMKKKRYHCPECTSIRHPSAGPGNYDMCIACYDGSSIAKEISDENRSAGLRRCLAGHRMQLISFVESSTGLRRAISHDIVGGRSLRITPYEGKEFAGLELERWRWKFETANTQWVDRLVTKNVSESAPLMAYLHPHSDGTSQWTTMFPPDIYRSQRAIAMWSWYPQDQADELLFPKGAEICEIQDVNGEWFWGAYMGTTGLFPASYVRSLDEDY